MAVRLRRTGGSSGAVSVDYATASGSATSSADFSAANGTMSWSDGDTADKTIEINIFADEIDEGSESFLIELSNPSGGAMLAATELGVQIAAADNDPPPDTSGGGSGGGGGAIGLVFLVSMMLLVTAASSRGGRSASRSWQWRRTELPEIPAARRDARPPPRGASPVHDRECDPRA